MNSQILNASTSTTSGNRRRRVKEEYKVYCLSVDDPSLDVELADEDKAMQINVFKKLEEYEIEPIWISTAEVLRIKSRERTDSFIFPKFEGSAFQHLVSLQCKIYGTMIIRQRLECGQNLPKFQQPIWSSTLENAVICFTGIAADVRAEKTRLIEYMNGAVSSNLIPAVTHLVAENCDTDSSKYLAATKLKLPVVSANWIDEAWKTATQHNPLKMIDPETVKGFIIPIFSGCEICVSGFGRDERDNLAHLIESNGGTFKGELNKHTCTHLVTRTNSGEKFKKAMEWKKHVITWNWVEKSVGKGFRLREKDYHPSVKCSTPNLSRDAPQLDVPNISSIGPAHKISFDEPSINFNISSLNTSRSHVANTISSRVYSTRIPSQKTTTTAPSTSVSLARSASTRTAPSESQRGATTLARTTTTSRLNSPAPSSSSANNTHGSNTTRNRTLMVNTRDPIDELNITVIQQVEDLMEGCRLYLCGLATDSLVKYKRLVNKLGATLVTQFDATVTHAIVGNERLTNETILKLRELAASTSLAVVRSEWLIDSIHAKAIANVEDYTHQILSTDDARETLRRRTPEKENTPFVVKTAESKLIRHQSTTFYGEAASSAQRQAEPESIEQPMAQNPADDVDSFLDDNVPFAEVHIEENQNPEPQDQELVQVYNDVEINGVDKNSFSAPMNNRVQALRKSTRLSAKRNSSLGSAPDMNMSCSPTVYVTGQRQFKLKLDLREAYKHINEMDSPTSSESLSSSAIGKILEVAVENTGRSTTQLHEGIVPENNTELAREEQMLHVAEPSKSREDLEKMFQLQEKMAKARLLQEKRLRGPSESRSNSTSRINSPTTENPFNLAGVENEPMQIDDSVSASVNELEARATTSKVNWDDRISTQDIRNITSTIAQPITDTVSSSINGNTAPNRFESPMKFPPAIPVVTIQKPSTSKKTSEIQSKTQNGTWLDPKKTQDRVRLEPQGTINVTIPSRVVEEQAEDTVVPTTTAQNVSKTRARNGPIIEMLPSTNVSNKKVDGYVSVSVVPSTSALQFDRSIRPIPSSPPRRTPPPRTVSIEQTGSPRKRKADLIQFPTSPQAKRRAAQEMERYVGAPPASTTSVTTARSSRTPPKNFVFTSFNADSPVIKMMCETIERLSGHVMTTENFPPTCTHLICEKMVKNEKILTAIATGRWVIASDYIFDSDKANGWLNEEDYEYAADRFLSKVKEADRKLAKASRKWRIELKNREKYPTGGAFYNWNVLFYVKPARADAFVRMLQQAGGSGIPRETIRDRVDYQEYTHALIDKNATSWNDEELSLLARARVKCYKLDFLITYLSEENPDAKEYLLPEYQKFMR
uniref:BRCT domain-containing protein n=1 Tax=Acrobeloides nanus TaxID=290746 RepID=A0A914ELQ0_9BILA